MCPPVSFEGQCQLAISEYRAKSRAQKRKEKTGRDTVSLLVEAHRVSQIEWKVYVLIIFICHTETHLPSDRRRRGRR